MILREWKDNTDCGISKLFESVLLNLFRSSFQRDILHYGFKKIGVVHLGCRDAIYTVRQVTETWFAANMCMPDLSKAFDRTNHYALLLN